MNKREDDLIDFIRNKQLVEEALNILNAKDARSLKVKMNDASWHVKKLALLEALETGDMKTANKLASEVLDLTEAKKQEVKGQFIVNERLQVLVAEVENLSDEQLYKRAEEIRRLREGVDPQGDEEARSREVLEMGDVTIQDGPRRLLPERTGVQPDGSASEDAE